MRKSETHNNLCIYQVIDGLLTLMGLKYDKYCMEMAKVDCPLLEAKKREITITLSCVSDYTWLATVAMETLSCELQHSLDSEVGSYCYCHYNQWR